MDKMCLEMASRCEMAKQHFIISRPPEALMTTVTYPSTKGYRTLRLPWARYEYDDFVSDNAFAKERLEELYGHYPDLFPAGFETGMCSTALRQRRPNATCAVVACAWRRTTWSPRWPLAL